ncbi:hypothetical protein TraAM80_09887 [Trypanosoma rangeli]|uniref:Uncharacterized protein n=1 Tax=Trypanosoma rangeli TaxID=5698 RepID=A0A3R7M507_TRYRA|nr:uncharacterized protein TraAM80_09887 [Trypanosoma rangeli]RNE96261.1 hypothetical protein TraAM80_09887 [Trypanosoma rangeli]|eukprot:RNE96261.1 hypothetical protein TraAM80_09887 [Trypanosoma rangeli]
MPFCNVTPFEASRLRDAATGEGEEKGAVMVEHAVLLAENIMGRYAEARYADCDSAGTDESPTSSSPSWFDAVRADAARTVREFPYPSLFLHPLPLNMREHPDAPPPFLLAQPTVAADGDADNGDVGGAPRGGHRAMLVLNGGAPAVVTVLQGECGLAVVAPRIGSTDSQGVYLLSPDATSCTIVACRVGLHPQLRQKVMAAAGEATESGDGAFAWRCCKTFTAAMGHFDSARGVAEALYEMLWETALPAWFHAALHNGGGTGGGGVVGAAADLVERLHRLSQTAAATDAAPAGLDAPVLVAEWFVVGGVRSRKHTLPILATVLGALLAAEETDGGGAVLPRGGRCILRPSFRLSDVLGGESKEGVGATSVRLAHRLREDGVCFWSLITVLRPWAGGRAGDLYSCPASWGLLVDVGGGGCWPATVQPGTRCYPLAALRHALVRSGFHWTCPLQREGTLRVRRVAATARATTYFGLKLTPPAESACNVSLATYVALFLHRREDAEAAEAECAAAPLPVLVRRGKWERLENVGVLDDVPDSVFLLCSTTPHCEPPDFAAIGRQRLSVMSEFSVADVFVEDAVGILA